MNPAIESISPGLLFSYLKGNQVVDVVVKDIVDGRLVRVKEVKTTRTHLARTDELFIDIESAKGVADLTFSIDQISNFLKTVSNQEHQGRFLRCVLDTKTNSGRVFYRRGQYIDILKD